MVVCMSFFYPLGLFFMSMAITLQAKVPLILSSANHAHSDTMACVERAWMQSVQQKAGGQFDIQSHFAGSALGHADQQFLQIASKKTDVSFAVASRQPGSMAALHLTAVPFAVHNDHAMIHAIMQAQGSIEATWHPNVKLATAFFAGDSVFVFDKYTDVSSWNDLKGKPIQTPSYGIIPSKLLGMHTQPMHPIAATTTQKTNHYGWFGSPSLEIHTRSPSSPRTIYHIPGMVRPVIAILINRDFFTQLPDTLKQAITDASDAQFALKANRCYLEASNRYEKIIKKQGGYWQQASTQDIETIKTVTKPARNMTLEMLSANFAVPAKPIYFELMRKQQAALGH